MGDLGVFPFGQPVRRVEQTDRTPKRVFVLGVYASAVHARWIGPDGKQRVRALAVASEPCIFWRGDGVESLLKEIHVPAELGRIEPAAPSFNGPSGTALDQLILEPLGLDRHDAWLADLVPHSCVNKSQLAAIHREYFPESARFSLPEATVPEVPKYLAHDQRRREILDEIEASQADVVILLGDQPLRWFLTPLTGMPKRLAGFGTEPTLYGRLHAAKIAGRNMWILPLAHPRQIARLGQSSHRWFTLHDQWHLETAPSLLGDGPT